MKKQTKKSVGANPLVPVARNLIHWLYAIREENESLVIDSAPDDFSLTDAISAIEAIEGSAFWRQGDRAILRKLVEECRR